MVQTAGMAEVVLPFHPSPLLGLYMAPRICSRVSVPACANVWAVVLSIVKACKAMHAIWSWKRKVGHTIYAQGGGELEQELQLLGCKRPL